MAQHKSKISFMIVIIVLCVVTAVSLTAIVYSKQITALKNQISGFQAPKLVNVSLNYTDNGQGIIHVTGYVYNARTVTAYGCQLNVNLYKNGALPTPLGYFLEKTF